MTATRLELGEYALTVPTGFGPRLLDLSWGGGPAWFARLDDTLGLDGGPSGRFLFRGGHRLWAAPEYPPVSYASDDTACRVEAGDGWVTVEGPVDAAGLRKSLRVEVSGDRLIVDHVLANDGDESREVAPWAITQLRLGGMAICPVGGAATGPQADRSLVIWPYTMLDDARLEWSGSAVLLRAEPGSQIKLGSGPAPHGLGYLLDGHLFTKQVPSAGDGAYADRGAVAQVYSNQHFLELESLGPIARLEPGDAATHREVWAVLPCRDVEQALDLIESTA